MTLPDRIDDLIKGKEVKMLQMNKNTWESLKTNLYVRDWEYRGIPVNFTKHKLKDGEVKLLLH
jgi:hypothetical protein